METKTEEIVWTVPWQQLSDADIVDEDEQNELMTWNGVFKAGQFRIGDMSANKIMQYARRGIVIPDERVDKAIGKFCDRKPRTVRYYRETAAFFPPMIRSKYDTLPFSHFAFARTMGDRWQQVLDYSMANLGISETFLERQFAPGGIGFSPDEPEYEPEIPDREMPYEPPSDLPKILSEVSQDIPEQATSHMLVVSVNAFASAMNSFCQLVINSKAPDDVKRVVIDAATTIKNNLPAILGSVV